MNAMYVFHAIGLISTGLWTVANKCKMQRYFAAQSFYYREHPYRTRVSPNIRKGRYHFTLHRHSHLIGLLILPYNTYLIVLGILALNPMSGNPAA